MRWAGLSIFFDTVRPDSNKARERLSRTLSDWRRDLLIEREARRGMPKGFTGAVEIRNVNVAPPQRKAGMLIGTILWFLLILMSAMGGFYIGDRSDRGRERTWHDADAVVRADQFE